MTTIFSLSSRVYSMAYNQDVIAVGFSDGIITLFNLKLSNVVRSWNGHVDWVLSLIFLSDGSLVSGSWDGFVKRWDLETGRDEKWTPKEISIPKERWARDLGGGIVYALAELPGGRLAAGCDDSTVRVLDLSTGQESSQGGVCRGHTCVVYAVISLGVVGDHTGSFASGSEDGTICVWTMSPIGGASATEGETTSPGTPGQVVEVGSSVTSLSLSPCGGLVAAGCIDGSVRLFHLPEWGDVWTRKGGSVKVHKNWVRSLSFSPDSRFFASASDDQMIVKILSSETGAILKTLEGHTDRVRSVLFSQDGFSVLSGSDDNTVRVWRLVDQDDRIASLLSGRTSLDLVYQGADVFKRLFTTIRTKLIGF